jgi:serine/threonine protein phosphatase PrpC
VTLALVICNLLTIANIGDSDAILDTGCSIMEITNSHRIATNTDEQHRLKAEGYIIAPIGFHLQGPAKAGEEGVGPVRIWPGGLCVGRSIGDADAGPAVVPLPSIQQIVLPPDGCRIILGSDGLWDCIPFSKVARMVRGMKADQAASELVSVASANTRIIDDTSAVVVDILPSASTTFPAIVQKAQAAHGGGAKKGGGFFSRLIDGMKPEPEEPSARNIPEGEIGHVDFMIQSDTLTEFPTARSRLKRNAWTPPEVLQRMGASRPTTKQ